MATLSVRSRLGLQVGPRSDNFILFWGAKILIVWVLFAGSSYQPSLLGLTWDTCTADLKYGASWDTIGSPRGRV